MCYSISDFIEWTDSLVCLGKKEVYVEVFDTNMNELTLYQFGRFLIFVLSSLFRSFRCRYFILI